MKATLSLRARLLVVATCVLLLFLGLTGFVLDQAFRRSAEEGLSERLLLHIYSLLATTEAVDGKLLLPEVLQEPDFNQLGSGLHAIVLDHHGVEIWRSPSAVDLSLSPQSTVNLYMTLAPGEPRFDRIDGDQSRSLFFMSYRVLWQAADDSTTPYTFVVLQTFDAYESEVSAFRNNLWGWLAGVVVALIAVQAAVMSWGLEPLRRLATDLKQIEDGRQDYLAGEYPAEIDRVTRNLNILLSNEREQREKYRTTLTDLAHSLKTPLAVLKSAVSPDAAGSDGDEALASVRKTVDEQVARMDEIVAYQLGRAMATSPSLTRRSIAVSPLVERLATAMEKVYADRGVHIDLDLSDASFLGDERDLMELLGNIVDNACKYCSHRVRIQTEARADGMLKMVVEDDGAGIPATDRKIVMRRGERLDAKTAGQGIGLAMVAEILARYGGRWEIDDSVLGGTRFTVFVPG